LTVLIAAFYTVSLGRSPPSSHNFGRAHTPRTKVASPFDLEHPFASDEVEAMTFRPLHDRVLVRRIEEAETTSGGIIIPDTAKAKPIQGEVIAVGPGARDDAGRIVPLEVKKGDRVLFGQWSGTEVRIDGQELLVMKESDIMGIVEGIASVRAAA
jgi:chaperonin GroES